MKRMLAITFCLPIIAFSQTDTSSTKLMRHEISFVGANLYVTPAYSYYTNSTVLFAPSGISYKYLINNKQVIRFSLEYDINIFEKRSEQNKQRISNDGNESTKQIRLGYERIFRTKKKVRPYCFADILYQQTSAAIVQSTNEISQVAPYSNYDSLTKIGQTAISSQLLIGAGLKYFANKRIFCSLETSLGLSYYSQIRQVESNANYSNGINGFGSYSYTNKYSIKNESTKGFMFTGNILRLSIGILI
jgi:hypothetical protein